MCGTGELASFECLPFSLFRRSVAPVAELAQQPEKHAAGRHTEAPAASRQTQIERPGRMVQVDVPLRAAAAIVNIERFAAINDGRGTWLLNIPRRVFVTATPYERRMQCKSRREGARVCAHGPRP